MFDTIKSLISNLATNVMQSAQSSIKEKAIELLTDNLLNTILIETIDRFIYMLYQKHNDLITKFKGNDEIVKLLKELHEICTTKKDLNSASAFLQNQLFELISILKESLLQQPLLNYKIDVADKFDDHQKHKIAEKLASVLLNALDYQGSKDSPDYRDWIKLKITSELKNVLRNSNQPFLLFQAIKKDKTGEHIKKCLVSGASANAIDSKSGDSALLSATKERNHIAVSLLLENQANPNLGTGYKDQWSPLYQAIYNGDIAIVASLLASGADPNHYLETQKEYKGWSPLCLAINNPSKLDPINQLRLIELLISHGANPNHSIATNDDWNGWTPLCMAIKKGLGQIACLIISNNANVNHKITTKHNWWNSMTPLMLAIFNDGKTLSKDDQKAVVDLLLNYRAEPNHTKTTGKFSGFTPLAFAIRNYWQNILTQPEIIVQSLLEKGADVNYFIDNDDYQCTPLCLAIANHWKDNSEKTVISIVTQLLEHHASTRWVKKNSLETLTQFAKHYKNNNTTQAYDAICNLINDIKYIINNEIPSFRKLEPLQSLPPLKQLNQTNPAKTKAQFFETKPKLIQPPYVKNVVSQPSSRSISIPS